MINSIPRRRSFKAWFGTLFATLLALVGVAASQTQQVHADSLYTEKIENVGSHWIKNNGSPVYEHTYWVIHDGGPNGLPVVCVDLGAPLEVGSNPGFSSQPVTNEQYQHISAIAYYGLFKAGWDNLRMMYTQWMVWESLGNRLVSTDNPAYESGFAAYKSRVMAQVNALESNPSFAGQTVTVNEGESITLTDTKGSLSSYLATPSSNTSGTTTSVSGNQLTISAGSNAQQSGTIQFNKDIASSYQGVPVLLSKAGYQTVMRPRLDPLRGHISLNIKVNKKVHVQLQKQDPDTDFGKNDPLAGVTFHFTHDGKDAGNYTTDANGQIKFDNLITEMTGNWTYQEVKTVAGFQLDTKTYSFKITDDDAGKTINLTAVNHRIPETVHTTATSEDGTHVQEPHKNVTITDRVFYGNLVPGKVYTVVGKLMDKQTGKELLVDGKPVTKTMTFTATKANGYVDMPFTFDGSLLAGKTVVAFESLSRDGREVAVHNDINDVPQTITFTTPGIHTTATDQDGTKDALPVKDLIIKDVVNYTNLIEGKTYNVRGVLMDKATGKAVLDANGKEIVATGSFVADKGGNGNTTLSYKLDASKFAGKSFVVFETVSRGGNDIVSHADINDKGQTVKIVTPGIHTTATDVDGSKEVVPETNVVVKDAVKYNDLVIGKTYTVTGTLHYADGKEVIMNGKAVTASKTFKATQKDGTIDMLFTVDGRILAGKSVVAFEDLSYNGQKLVSHADVNDKGQTVTFPKIELHTTATSNGNKTVTASNNMTIDDVVAFHDLVVGKTYTVKGYLVDKATGKPLMINGKRVEAETTFKATAKDQNVTMHFNFDGSSLGGHDVVAFENLYHDGKLIASHADINDAGQTVHIAPKPAVLTQTGDSANLTVIALAAIALIAAVAGIVVVARKKA